MKLIEDDDKAALLFDDPYDQLQLTDTLKHPNPSVIKGFNDNWLLYNCNGDPLYPDRPELYKKSKNEVVIKVTTQVCQAKPTLKSLVRTGQNFNSLYSKTPSQKVAQRDQTTHKLDLKFPQKTPTAIHKKSMNFFDQLVEQSLTEKGKENKVGLMVSGSNFYKKCFIKENEAHLKQWKQEKSQFDQENPTSSQESADFLSIMLQSAWKTVASNLCSLATTRPNQRQIGRLSSLKQAYNLAQKSNGLKKILEEDPALKQSILSLMRRYEQAASAKEKAELLGDALPALIDGLAAKGSSKPTAYRTSEPMALTDQKTPKQKTPEALATLTGHRQGFSPVTAATGEKETMSSAPKEKAELLGDALPALIDGLAAKGSSKPTAYRTSEPMALTDQKTPKQKTPEALATLTGHRQGFSPVTAATDEQQTLGPIMSSAQENQLINTRPVPDPQLRKMLDKNHHHILFLTQKETFEVVKDLEGVKKTWHSITESKVGITTVSYGVNVKDIVTTSILIARLRDFGIKAIPYINKAGNEVIKITGYPGIRKILNGTVYRANNVKVVEIGVGKYGLKNTIASGAKLSIYVVAAYRTVDYFLTDEQSLAEYLGSLAGDLIKIGILSVLTFAVGTFFAVTAGSILFAAAVTTLLSLGTSVLLNKIDEKIGFTEGIVDRFEGAQQDFVEHARKCDSQAIWDLGAMQQDGKLEQGKGFAKSEVLAYRRQQIKELRQCQLLREK